jgi:hypothetical protein
LSIDDIKVGHLMVLNTKYQHDFNGTREPVIEKFYGTMGCNGSAKFEFSSPVYLWILENL